MPPSQPTRYDHDRAIGLDLGASTAHAVALSLDADERAKPTVLAADVFDVATDNDALVRFCASPHIAIDAPERPSEGPHLGDSRMGAKFQTGRCAEGALGRKYGLWVPWVTPRLGDPVPSWIRSGFEVWTLLQDRAEPIEVYPYAIFRRLAGRPLPRKQTVAGRNARLELLARHIELPPFAAWSHDSVDALAAALVAWHHWRGTAEAVTCGPDDEWPDHDTSALWLPPPG